jgi:hypothetical protein
MPSMTLGEDEDLWSGFYKDLAAWHGKKGLWNASLGDQAMSNKLYNQAHGSFWDYGFADPSTPVHNAYTPDQYAPTKQAWHPHGTSDEVISAGNAKLENYDNFIQQRHDDRQQQAGDAAMRQFTQESGNNYHAPQLTNSASSPAHGTMMGNSAMPPVTNSLLQHSMQQSPLAPLNPQGDPHLAAAHQAILGMAGMAPQQQQQLLAYNPQQHPNSNSQGNLYSYYYPQGDPRQTGGMVNPPVQVDDNSDYYNFVRKQRHYNPNADMT